MEKHAEKTLQLIHDGVEKFMDRRHPAPAEEQLAHEQKIIEALERFDVRKNFFQSIVLLLQEKTKHLPVPKLLDYLRYLERIHIRDAAKQCEEKKTVTELREYVSYGINIKLRILEHEISWSRPEILVQNIGEHTQTNGLIRNLEKPLHNRDLLKSVVAGDPEIHVTIPPHDSESIKQSCIFSPPLSTNETPRFISDAVVGIFDEHGSLVRVGEVEKHIVEKPFPYSLEQLKSIHASAQKLRNAESSMHENANLYPHIYFVLKYGDTNIIEQLHDAGVFDYIDESTREHTVQTLSKHLHTLELDENHPYYMGTPAEFYEERKKPIVKKLAQKVNTLLKNNPDLLLKSDSSRQNQLYSSDKNAKLFFRSDVSQRLNDAIEGSQYTLALKIIGDFIAQLQLHQFNGNTLSDASLQLIHFYKTSLSNLGDSFDIYDHSFFNLEFSAMRQGMKLPYEYTNNIKRESKNILNSIPQEKYPAIAAVLDTIVETRTQEFHDFVPHVQTMDVETVVDNSKWNPHSSPEENDALLKTIYHLYNPENLEIVEKTYDLTLARLSFSTQLQLLRFIGQADHVIDIRFRKILKSFKENPYDFLESFFALAAGEQNTDRLLTIMENAHDPHVENIFHFYAAIVRRISAIEAYIADTMQGASSVDSRTIVQTLLTRANAILFSLDDHIQSESTPDISEQLDQLNDEVIVFASLCERTIKKNPDVRIEELAHINYVEVTGDQLDDTQKERLLTLSKANHRHRPYVWKDVESLLFDPNRHERLKKTSFRILERQRPEDDEPILLSFLRIETLDEDSIFIGSLNVNEFAQGAGIGEHIVPLVLQEVHPHKNIYARVATDVQAGTYYVEKLGAQFIDFEQNPDPQQPQNSVFQLLLPKQDALERSTQQSQLRQKTPADIIQLYEQSFRDSDPLDHRGEDVIVAQFHTETDIADICRVANTLLHNPGGYTMTRYFCVDRKTDPSCTSRIYGFEKNI